MRAFAVPIAVAVLASVIGAVVASRDAFGNNVVLDVALFLACVLALVSSWELWEFAGGSRPRATRAPARAARTTRESAGE